MKINPILLDELIRLDSQFIKDIGKIKEKFYSLNIMPCSGYGLAILERYIAELNKIAECIFEDSPKHFHQIFENIYLKELKPKLISDLDSIQETHQVDEAYKRVLNRYTYEKQKNQKLFIKRLIINLLKKIPSIFKAILKLTNLF